MPYIKEKMRKYYALDLLQILGKVDSDTPKGEVNYILSMIIIKTIGAKLNYDRISEMRDVLLDVWDEVGRRVMHPYEDKKKKENGDLPWPKIK